MTELSHQREALTEVKLSAQLADEALLLTRDAATSMAVATHDRDRARLTLLLATGRLPSGR